MLTYLVLNREENIILNLYKEKALDTANLVANDLIFMMLEKDTAIVSSNIEELNRTRNIIIGVVGIDGTPAFNTDITVPFEIFSAQKESYFTSGNEFVFFKPLQNDKACHACHSQKDKTRGMIIIKTSFLEAKAEIDKTAKRLLFFAIFMGLMTEILLITILKKTVLDPLNRLTEGAETLKNGKLDHRIDIKSNDEIGSLATSFNDMAENLQKSHANLENAVRKKTKELRVVAELSGKIFKGDFTLDEIINQSLDVITSEMQFDYAALCLIDRDSGALTHEYIKGIRSDFCPVEHLLTSDHPLIRIMREGKPAVKLAADVGAPDEYGHIVIIPLLSHHRKRCRETNRCSKKDCPAFQSVDERCWLIRDTLCRSPQAVAGKDKLFGCLHCNAFPIIGTLITGKKEEIVKSSLHSLEILTSEIVSAIENHNFISDKKKDIDNLITLHDISIKTLQKLNYRELIGSIASSATIFANTDASILWSLGQDRQLHIEGVSNIDKNMLPDSLSLDDLLTVRSRTDDRLTESTRYEDFSGLSHLFARHGFLYTAVVPLKHRDTIFGFLMLFKQKDFFMTESEKAITSLFANQAAAAIQTAKLYGDLLAQKDFTETIFNNAASGIMVTDKEGYVMKINNTGADILQIKIPDIVGRKITDIYHETKEMLSVSSSFGREITINMPDGTSIPIGFSSSVLAGTTERKEGLVILFRNMSEIKKLQAELRKKDHFETMGKVISGVAHEIRNPLFGISSIGQIIERETDESHHKTLLQAMLKETSRMKQLINELILYTKPLHLDIKEIDIGLLAEKLLYDSMPQKKGIQVLADIPQGLVIKADQEKIMPVFLNLLKNAVEAAINEVTITARTYGNTITITFADDGLGIKQEDLSRIFDPFFTTKRGGIGLGLSICKKIIEEHGAEINIQSTIGKGTTVTLTFKT